MKSNFPPRSEVMLALQRRPEALTKPHILCSDPRHHLFFLRQLEHCNKIIHHHVIYGTFRSKQQRKTPTDALKHSKICIAIQPMTSDDKRITIVQEGATHSKEEDCQYALQHLEKKNLVRDQLAARWERNITTLPCSQVQVETSQNPHTI